MTTQEGSRGEAARRQKLHDKAYFLDLLGDGHQGLGRHVEAIEAYRQAADGFRSQGAGCSHALCLFKIADSYLSLSEPWHALGYLETCLPLLRDLGLTRHQALAQQQLDLCRAELATAVLLGEGGSAFPRREAGRPARGRLVPAQPGETRSPCRRGKSTFLLCTGPVESHDG